MRISWRNLFWKLLTFLILEIDAFSLTEQAFCNDVLHSYLLTKNIALEAPTIKHSNGGIVAWDTLRKQIVRHLNEGNSIVSLFVDYYRIRDSYRFPGWMESKSISNIYDRMHFLFEQMSLDIEENLRGIEKSLHSYQQMNISLDNEDLISYEQQIANADIKVFLYDRVLNEME